MLTAGAGGGFQAPSVPAAARQAKNTRDAVVPYVQTTKSRSDPTNANRQGEGACGSLRSSLGTAS